MQKIETVDMPRSKALASGQTTLGELQTTMHDDFRNRLIWGDNKLDMASLASLLKEFRGKIDLIYINPPFDVGGRISRCRCLLVRKKKKYF
jgi:adenine-specific DNA-methyltransferase